MAEIPNDSDIWADWLLHKRHADDPVYADEVRAGVLTYVDYLLDRARLQPGMTLLDVGTGEGAVAFRAIERVGPGLKVVLTDISRALLNQAQAEASRREVNGQCSFVLCAADDLSNIAEASIDILTTRAVLAYVADKPAALREFRRVLKPGGRISLAEPIFQYDAIETAALRMTVERGEGGPQRELLRLIHRWKSSQFPDTPAAIAARPMTNFTERTLWDVARSCGFTDMHMELHVDMGPAPIRSWDVFLGLSPHPLAASLGQILAEQFSAEERRILEQAMRPTIEAGKALTASNIAYITGGR